jgi:predicted GNAT superfamily acetyltransferase
MLGIHPRLQGGGIGAALKWRQRERALEQGLDLMTWTFDPLEAQRLLQSAQARRRRP